MQIDKKVNDHIHCNCGDAQECGENKTILTIRIHSGLAGDIMFTGLAILNLNKKGVDPAGAEANKWLNDLCASITPELDSCVKLVRKDRFGIFGWSLEVNLPYVHEHRNLLDMRTIADSSSLCEEAKRLGIATFELLAECEAEVHNKAVEDIHFHEVGALDSILDIFGVCELYCRLGSPLVVSSPLPMADGDIKCAHGILPAPAPASLKLVQGLPVKGFCGSVDAGELLTPTSLALLRALHVDFGPWPSFIVDYTVLAWGQKVFTGAPNGTIFALGHGW